MKILITGGTVFVSRFMAEFFVNKNHEVYVLNRNSRPQSQGVKLINCDRHNLGDALKNYIFDLVVDVTAYDKRDVDDLLDGLGTFTDYIMISSSAVYPETNIQPFKETQKTGANLYWGGYGINKIEAERALFEKIPNAYILRPPYLYGKMNNLYREAFAFDCAERNLPFYLPKDGQMTMQFFDVEDMCRFIEILVQKKPRRKIFNVGNPEPVTIREWACICYKVLGKKPEFEYVTENINQRDYFPFLDYGYVLDISEQQKLMFNTKPLFDGLKQSYDWYKNNRELVRRKNYIEYIKNNLEE